jgi:phenylpropionate dioxygenase-like ring-hydroxylating dioxygenase large terminal subunit
MIEQSTVAERRAVLERLRAHMRPDAGQVPTFIYTDPAVYALELERIFQRAWLFVAHESEVPRRGAYVTREMGEQPVVVARGTDEQVRVFLNVCRHRGARVVRSDLGQAATFQCTYHGFTYTCNGALARVPFQDDAYAEGIDRATLGLHQARVATYRGLIFATWDPAAPPLDEFLGGVRWYLDIMVGRAEMEIVGPPQKWVVPTSWKFPAENFVTDAYHTAYTHASIARVFLGGTPNFGQEGYHVAAGGGHGLGIGIQDDGPWYPDELRAEYERHLTADQLRFVDRIKNFHGSVFPNMSFLIPNVIEIGGKRVTGTTLRLWQPLGPERIQVYSWYLVEKNAPDWWKELGRRTYVQTFGPSGMFEQDDTENWEGMTRNCAALLPRGDTVTLNFHMGLGRQPLADFPGPGDVYAGKFSEAAARGFYRRWLDLMLAE